MKNASTKYTCRLIIASSQAALVHKVWQLEKLLISLTLMIFILFSSACANSASEKPPEPFQSNSGSTKELCQYTYYKPNDGHRGKPSLFRNVNEIYIRVSGLRSFPLEKAKVSKLFELNELSTLAACTLEKQLSGGSTKSPIPIYLPGKNFSKWPAAAGKDHALIILVQYSLISGKGFYEDMFDDRIVSLNFTYFRPDVRDFDAVRYGHCAQAFQYTENEDRLLHMLTKALHSCLDQDYHNMN